LNYDNYEVLILVNLSTNDYDLASLSTSFEELVIHFWNTNTGELKDTIVLEKFTTYSPFHHILHSISSYSSYLFRYSPNYTTLISFDNQYLVFSDGESIRIINFITREIEKTIRMSDGIKFLDKLPNGDLVCVDGNGNVRILN
jgi:hypothetical protein